MELSLGPVYSWMSMFVNSSSSNVFSDRVMEFGFLMLSNLTRLRALKPEEGRKGCDFQDLLLVTRHSIDICPLSWLKSLASRVAATLDGRSLSYHKQSQGTRPLKPTQARIGCFSRCFSFFPLALPEESPMRSSRAARWAIRSCGGPRRWHN